MNKQLVIDNITQDNFLQLRQKKDNFVNTFPKFKDEMAYLIYLTLGLDVSHDYQRGLLNASIELEGVYPFSYEIGKNKTSSFLFKENKRIFPLFGYGTNQENQDPYHHFKEEYDLTVDKEINYCAKLKVKPNLTDTPLNKALYDSRYKNYAFKGVEFENRDTAEFIAYFNRVNIDLLLEKTCNRFYHSELIPNLPTNQSQLEDVKADPKQLKILINNLSDHLPFISYQTTIEKVEEHNDYLTYTFSLPQVGLLYTDGEDENTHRHTYQIYFIKPGAICEYHYADGFDYTGVQYVH